MDTIHIILCIDEKYAQHAGVTIASILHNKSSRNPIIFHIVNDGLPPKEYHTLKQICDNYGAAIISHSVNSTGFSKLPVGHHISKATYYRLIITEILPSSIEKALYLDVDLIVRSDISDLWNTDISAHYAAAILDIGIEEKGAFLRQILGMPPQEPYFNAGVLLMNVTKWRTESISTKVISFIADNAKDILYADQDGLNAILWGKWLPVHPKWNVYRVAFRKYYKWNEKRKLSNDLLQAVRNPCIVHFTGPLKPWHDSCLMPYVSEYYFYLAMTPWKGYQAPRATIHQRFRKYRQKLRRYVMDLLN
jgi:lipopolysaccharide biosynthesis glycosyltransferase